MTILSVCYDYYAESSPTVAILLCVQPNSASYPQEDGNVKALLSRLPSSGEGLLQMMWTTECLPDVALC